LGGSRSPWGRDVSLRRSGRVSGRQLRRAAARQAELVSVGASPGGEGWRSCRGGRRGLARPRERQGDDRARLTAGRAPAA
jgi:hypothetical protein